MSYPQNRGIIYPVKILIKELGIMEKPKESLGEFWDEWEKETEDLARSNREAVEKIKAEAKRKQDELLKSWGEADYENRN